MRLQLQVPYKVHCLCFIAERFKLQILTLEVSFHVHLLKRESLSALTVDLSVTCWTTANNDVIVSLIRRTCSQSLDSPFVL